MPSYDELRVVAEKACRAGANALLPYFRREGLAVSEKSRNDLVSEADRSSEAAIVGVLGEAFPGHAILAEEGGARQGRGAATEHEWLIDPLDGTTNFVHGHPIFAISLACRCAGELVAGAVYEPVAENLFTAARGCGARWNGRPISVTSRVGLQGALLATGFPFRAHAVLDVYLRVFREVFLAAQGIRRCGAAALDLAYTAAGIYDGFFELCLAPWDIAAGALLVREAGGQVSDLAGGERFLESGHVVAGGVAVQALLREAIANQVSEDGLAVLFSRRDEES